MQAPLIHTVLLLLIEFASSINRSSQLHLTQTSLTQPISNQLVYSLFVPTEEDAAVCLHISKHLTFPPSGSNHRWSGGGGPDPVLEDPDPVGFCVLPLRSREIVPFEGERERIHSQVSLRSFTPSEIPNHS